MALIPKWRVIQLGAMPVKEELGPTVTQVGAHMSQNQQCVPHPVLHTVPCPSPVNRMKFIQAITKALVPLRYAWVEVLKLGDARVEWLEIHRMWNC